MAESPHSPRRDRQLGMVWWPEMPSVHHRLAVIDNPLEALRTGICPYCGAGPYTLVAGHTIRAHGVDRYALRDAFGLTYSTSICDPTHSRMLSEKAREQLRRRPDMLKTEAAAKTRRRKRRLSKGALVSLRERILAASDDEQRREANRAAVRRLTQIRTCLAEGCSNLILGARKRTCSPECKQARIKRKGFASTPVSPEARARGARAVGDALMKPHPCPMCGTEVPMQRQRFCSDECRAASRRRNSEQTALRNKARGAALPVVIPSCHPDRPHACFGLCHMCYRREWRKRRKAEGKRVT